MAHKDPPKAPPHVLKVPRHPDDTNDPKEGSDESQEDKTETVWAENGPKEEPKPEESELVEKDETAAALAKKAEASALEAQRVAVAAAGEAERLKRIADARMPPKKMASAEEFPDDINVLCLKDNARVVLGPRHYSLKQGQTVKMHPSHALELEQNGWVLRR